MASENTEESQNIRHKEKKRTECINKAFAELRKCIPNVPSDTKLSKIKTLRLASSYISFLSELLEDADASCPTAAKEFHAELQVLRCRERHINRRLDFSTKRKIITNTNDTCRVVGIQSTRETSSPSISEKKKGRTGWPEAVWAEALESLERTKKNIDHKSTQDSSNKEDYNPEIWSHTEPQQSQLEYYRYISDSANGLQPELYSHHIGMNAPVTNERENLEPTFVQANLSSSIIYPANSQIMDGTRMLRVFESGGPASFSRQLAEPNDTNEENNAIFTNIPAVLPSISTLSCVDKFQGISTVFSADFFEHSNTLIESTEQTSNDLGPNLIELQPVSISKDVTMLLQ